MLYWFTHLTETTPKLVEKDLAEAIRVLDVYKTSPAQPGQLIGRPFVSQFSTQPSNLNASGYPNNQFSLAPAENDLVLDFKPWLSETHCGGRVWNATLLPENQPVIVKCWDAYNMDASRRDNEVAIYMKIQPLWDVCVPRFIAKGEIDFCHSIILQYIQVFVLCRFVTYNRGRLCHPKI